MSRQEYLQKLEELLLDISKEEREEALAYYRDYFADAGEEEEEKVMKELGSPETVAEQIKEGLSWNSREKGVFTEQKVQEGEYRKEEFSDWKQEETAKRRNKFGGNLILKILLVLFLCVIAVPVGIPLLAAFFALGAAVLAILFFCGISGLAIVFSIALVIGILVVIFCVLGILFLFFGITCMFTMPSTGLLLMGSGLLMLAVGLLLLLLVVWIGGTVIPVVARGTVNLIRRIFDKIFGRRGGRKR